ncbi:MAG: Thymidylate kinase [Firmicutes bacterium]|nr:Thymidylate kinase [Bacillota bacterium]MDI6705101.1 deoxynucleoside kinase [Bacillota bacterium]
MKGKLIIIEAGDASGKATQTLKLYNRLKDERYNVMRVEYPNYKSDSSALIKMYLNGEFGSRPEDVNPYVASTFFAVDRFASYKKEWEDFYNGGGIVVSDRYTTSNMIHQAAKIQDKKLRDSFLEWLWNFEFELFGLPVPDCVVFLNMPPEFSRKLLKERNNKYTGEKEKDIHESDLRYLANSYNNALEIADKYNWDVVDCIADGMLRPIEDIHREIYRIVIDRCIASDQ